MFSHLLLPPVLHPLTCTPRTHRAVYITPAMLTSPAPPLPRPQAMARAPLVVKREVDQATSDWAQHHAKRLIDTKAKGLRGSIPPNFPYFYVQFGYSAGFVHVIDDEAKFSPSFGRQVGGWVAGRAGCGGGHGALLRLPLQYDYVLHCV
jgi:hypothetical protein